MKITGIRTLSLSRKHESERVWASATFVVRKADCSIVIIETDDGGVCGIGEPSAYGTPPVIAESVSKLAPHLIGKDPADPNLLMDADGRTLISRAEDRVDAIVIAGIDCALWDLRAKIEGVRVCDLIGGGEPHDRIRLYASGGVAYDWEDHPESLVEQAVQVADEGFTAFKMRIGTEWSWSGVTAERFIDLLRKVHAAAGDRLDMMVDGNCRLTEEEALKIGRAMDEMGFYWFEEPIPAVQIDGYARLNEALETPVTGGEALSTFEQIEPYLEKKAYAIVQVDAGVSGLSECIRVTRRAAEFGVPHCPHSWHNGLMAVYHAHMMAAMPEPRVLELNVHQGPLQWDILREKPKIEAGYLVIPDGPGYGVELADDLEARFPFIEGSWAESVTR